MQEDHRAETISSGRVEERQRALVEQIMEAVAELQRQTTFFDRPWTSYEECLERVKFFKSYVEDMDGYKLLNKDGKPFSNEKEVQLAFGLVWGSSDLAVNREPNNGRDPVDFKASFGAGDKSLIEFKLGSNRQLTRILENHVAIYENANQTRQSVKAIVFNTAEDEARVQKILGELKLSAEESIVLIDARRDNKPSAMVDSGSVDVEPR